MPDLNNMQPILDNLRAAFAGLPNCGNSPPGMADDPGDCNADDYLTEFENALGAAVTIQANKTGRLNPTLKFKLDDIEVNCIPDNGRVRILISAQTELTLDVEDVRDLDEAVSKVSASMGNLWACIR